jgi:hypothetical protein
MTLILRTMKTHVGWEDAKDVTSSRWLLPTTALPGHWKRQNSSSSNDMKADEGSGSEALRISDVATLRVIAVSPSASWVAPRFRRGLFDRGGCISICLIAGSVRRRFTR